MTHRSMVKRFETPKSFSYKKWKTITATNLPARARTCRCYFFFILLNSHVDVVGNISEGSGSGQSLGRDRNGYVYQCVGCGGWGGGLRLTTGLFIICIDLNFKYNVNRKIPKTVTKLCSLLDICRRWGVNGPNDNTHYKLREQSVQQETLFSEVNRCLCNMSAKYVIAARDIDVRSYEAKSRLTIVGHVIRTRFVCCHSFNS